MITSFATLPTSYAIGLNISILILVNTVADDLWERELLSKKFLGNKKLYHESSEKEVGWKLKCPFCGEKVAKPDKVWSLKGDLTIGSFRCPNCGRAFRIIRMAE